MSRWDVRWLWVLVLPAWSCGPAPVVPGAGPMPGPTAHHAASGVPDSERPAPVVQGSPACSADADCGYDPAADRCGTDPRYNHQPPIVDQGILCYCDEPSHACALLKVPPVPCEGDAGCAVKLSPRPHPVRADRDNPRERGRPCRDLAFSTTCEQTNICTLHRHECSGP